MLLRNICKSAASQLSANKGNKCNKLQTVHVLKEKEF